jgi:hypothetical protein
VVHQTEEDRDNSIERIEQQIIQTTGGHTISNQEEIKSPSLVSKQSLSQNMVEDDVFESQSQQDLIQK